MSCGGCSSPPADPITQDTWGRFPFCMSSAICPGGTNLALALGVFWTYSKFWYHEVELYTFHVMPAASSCSKIGGNAIVAGALSSIIPPQVPATSERWFGRLSLITDVKYLSQRTYCWAAFQ